MDAAVLQCYDVTVLRCRRQHGCAVARSAAGNLGIVVVGGTGDSEADKVTSVQEDVVLRSHPFHHGVHTISVVVIQVSTSVEFLDLTVPGARWVEWPSLATPRCCWPKVNRKYFIQP